MLEVEISSTVYDVPSLAPFCCLYMTEKVKVSIISLEAVGAVGVRGLLYLGNSIWNQSPFLSFFSLFLPFSEIVTDLLLG